MAMLRLLAVGLLSGVIAVPFLWNQRGEGFEHARLAALMALDMGQFVGVSVGLVVGFVLAATGRWNRTPGYVLGTITAAFGVLVATQAWPTMSWVDGRPSGLGDPDGESVIAFLAFASGLFTILVGLSIVLLRWSGYDPRTAPARRQRGPRRDPSLRGRPRG
ncbi:hypothetical protein AB0K40_40825 [Nonomuraea bangladeshensis]|uniref:Uncharacterized protein n=1 Tax=Nonomuraea bangladeshensis TaxID=404385 RepID=A0ABV3HH73_9ACTN